MLKDICLAIGNVTRRKAMSIKSMGFSGGRESSPVVTLVPSNYHKPFPGEVLLSIDSPVSISTLEAILEWAKQAQKSGEKLY
jgi:hypothetical protein